MKAIVSKANGHDSIVMISRNNPESAAIMLRSEVATVNDNGFLQVDKRVGLFKGNTEDIQKIASGLRDGDDFSAKVFPVKLIVKEQTEPFYPGQEPKINPTTGEVVNHKGSPIYRSTFVVSESSTDTDLKLSNDTVSEPAKADLTPSSDFAKK
jgi:hypothetical protein